MPAVAGPEIERLIQLLAKLPGLGPRSARRAALHLIKKREQLIAPLAAALRTASKGRGLPAPAATSTPEPLHGLRRSAAPRSILVVVADVADLWALERPARSTGATTCSAARSRRSTASARTTSPSTRWSRARTTDGQRGHPRAQRHGRRPDHRALRHRPPARRQRQGDAARAWRAGRRRARLSRRGHALGRDPPAHGVLILAL